MRTGIIVGILIGASLQAYAQKPTTKLPTKEQILTIAVAPQLPEQPSYFTPESLLGALPQLKSGTAKIKVGAKHFWQSGVIVLKNKKVLFWRTCRNNFIYVQTAEGVDSFIIGDGKDNI